MILWLCSQIKLHWEDMYIITFCSSNNIKAFVKAAISKYIFIALRMHQLCHDIQVIMFYTIIYDISIKRNRRQLYYNNAPELHRIRTNCFELRHICIACVYHFNMYWPDIYRVAHVCAIMYAIHGPAVFQGQCTETCWKYVFQVKQDLGMSYQK